MGFFFILLGIGHNFQKRFIGLLGQHFCTFYGTSRHFQNGSIGLLSLRFGTFPGIWRNFQNQRAYYGSTFSCPIPNWSLFQKRVLRSPNSIFSYISPFCWLFHNGFIGFLDPHFRISPGISQSRNWFMGGSKKIDCFRIGRHLQNLSKFPGFISLSGTGH